MTNLVLTFAVKFSYSLHMKKITDNMQKIGYIRKSFMVPPHWLGKKPCIVVKPIVLRYSVLGIKKKSK